MSYFIFEKVKNTANITSQILSSCVYMPYIRQCFQLIFFTSLFISQALQQNPICTQASFFILPSNVPRSAYLPYYFKLQYLKTRDSTPISFVDSHIFMNPSFRFSMHISSLFAFPVLPVHRKRLEHGVGTHELEYFPPHPCSLSDSSSSCTFCCYIPASK